MEENKRRPNIAGRRKRSHMSIVALLFFFFCCFVLICVILTPDKTFSESENRSLAVRPKLTAEGLLDGSWFTEFNSWFSDQFPARDGWIVLNYFGNVLSGKKETEDIYAGKDGYLLAKPTVPTEDALKQLPAAMNEFHEKNPGLKMSMLIVPDAATILEEKLPANAPVRDQLADIAEFTERVSADIRRLDAAAPLSENSSEYIYYRTDHHWTSQGAQIVFLANAEKLGIDSPVVYVPHYLSNSFEGTLASRTGNHFSKDTITAFEPQSDTDYYVMYPDLNKKKASILETEMLDEKDQYTVFFGGNHALVEIRTTADNGRNLLVLKAYYA
ncbi:MAG: hypothetical protein HUJ73_08630, partial [Eubacterium sp.]|nr:hypothetical protein [Eubacterium sp.]